MLAGFSQVSGEPTSRSPRPAAELAQLAPAVDFALSQLEFADFSTTLELRLEAFNALNRTQFAFPDSNVADPTFGVVRAAAPGRILQLGAKLRW